MFNFFDSVDFKKFWGVSFPTVSAFFDTVFISGSTFIKTQDWIARRKIIRIPDMIEKITDIGNQKDSNSVNLKHHPHLLHHNALKEIFLGYF